MIRPNNDRPIPWAARRITSATAAAGAALMLMSIVAGPGTAAAGAARALSGAPRSAGLGATPRGTITVPRPLVTGPITGGTHGRPFTSSPVPLGLAGYTEQEFFLRGTATGYLPATRWHSNGIWPAKPAETAPYETRILVRRPANPANFNGTVVVEWLNVSFAVDVDPDFLYESQELLRAGYAWVGVSAQQLGVQGPLGLRSWDPARYHALHHPGDTFSYSIFSQAAEALLHPRGARPLGPLHPRALLADGESQSAERMVTYANAIQPLDRLFNGFLIHSRGAPGAPISQAPQRTPPMPAIARIRTDLGVPVLTVETETDIVPSGLGYLPATQTDHHNFRLWEVAGTSHVDSTELGMSASEVLRDIPNFPQGSCASLPNDGQERYVMDAAVAQLSNWARTGAAPRHVPRIKISGGKYVTDKFGNAVGGLRTPAVDAPVATLTGLGNSGSSPLCFLLGTSTPLTAKQLSTLYPNHAVYVADVQKAAQAGVAKGVLLPADVLAIDAAAAGSTVGLPAPTGRTRPTRANPHGPLW